MTKLGPFKFGNATAQLVPHYVPGVGARLFMILDGDVQHAVRNLTADDARALADYLKLGACQAEGMEQKQRRLADKVVA